MPAGPLLITGADGFIGARLMAHLHNLGEEAVPAVREGAGLDGAVPLELGDEGSVDAAIRGVRPQVVINLAGIADPGQADADPQLAYRINVQGQLWLIEALLRHCPSARLVAIGSAYQYGIGAASGPIAEDAPLAPEGVYALTKTAADLQAYQYHVSHGLDAVRLRLFTIIGPGRSEAYFPARQIRRVAEILDRGADPVVETYSLAGARDFVDVRDAAAAIAAAARRGVAGAAYNVATGIRTPLRQVIDELITLAARDLRVVEHATPAAGRQAVAFAGDPARLARDTGWRARISLRESLQDALHEQRAKLQSATR